MNIMKWTKPAEILLVEDSPIDVHLVKEALQNYDIPNNVHVVMNGDDAVDFVRKQGKFSDVPRPDMMLLDLNFPKKDGREVLVEMKADKELRQIPVIIFTTSKDKKDVQDIYNLYANCYVTKPVDMHRFLEVIQAVSKFWLTVAALPTDSE